jgi:hypothetical protein
LDGDADAHSDADSTDNVDGDQDLKVEADTDGEASWCGDPLEDPAVCNPSTGLTEPLVVCSETDPCVRLSNDFINRGITELTAPPRMAPNAPGGERCSITSAGPMV